MNNNMKAMQETIKEVVKSLRDLSYTVKATHQNWRGEYLVEIYRTEWAYYRSAHFRPTDTDDCCKMVEFMKQTLQSAQELAASKTEEQETLEGWKDALQ